MLLEMSIYKGAKLALFYCKGFGNAGVDGILCFSYVMFVAKIAGDGVYNVSG